MITQACPWPTFVLASIIHPSMHPCRQVCWPFQSGLHGSMATPLATGPAARCSTALRCCAGRSFHPWPQPAVHARRPRATCQRLCRSCKAGQVATARQMTHCRRRCMFQQITMRGRCSGPGPAALQAKGTGCRAAPPSAPTCLPFRAPAQTLQQPRQPRCIAWPPATPALRSRPSRPQCSTPQAPRPTSRPARCPRHSRLTTILGRCQLSSASSVA